MDRGQFEVVAKAGGFGFGEPDVGRANGLGGESRQRLEADRAIRREAPDRLERHGKLFVRDHRANPGMRFLQCAGRLAFAGDFEGGEFGEALHHRQIARVEALVRRGPETAEHAVGFAVGHDERDADMRADRYRGGDRHRGRQREAGGVGDQFREPPGEDVAAIDFIERAFVARFDQMLESGRVDLAIDRHVADEFGDIGDLQIQMPPHRAQRALRHRIAPTAVARFIKKRERILSIITGSAHRLDPLHCWTSRNP